MTSSNNLAILEYDNIFQHLISQVRQSMHQIINSTLLRLHIIFKMIYFITKNAGLPKSVILDENYIFILIASNIFLGPKSSEFIAIEEIWCLF